MAERPEDLNLPTAVVNRIVREALPTQVKVSKEANAAIAKAASVFVLYATSCSNNVSAKANRKTITGGDVIAAIQEMEFDKFVHPLEIALSQWKGQQNRKKEDAKRKKEKAAASLGSASEDKRTTDDKENEEDDDEDNDDDDEEAQDNANME
ncbi:hypothetical protein TCAL_15222 [Tigriopus californicus]|uniref:DNA polymerase epsilon subunit 3 n=1 Tax=Tigriopus californicus TaxID=6832 RepID=A0A553NEE2_TIGCA|nr:DNA polymerase epsilon subunit 3-like [Tigriopus californicus]TRY63814.1 hypothetical protein TCAL_15222 [Tigriopus californicus]